MLRRTRRSKPYRKFVKDDNFELQLIANSDNIGFAAGQNQAFRMSESNYVLVLNPDVLNMSKASLSVANITGMQATRPVV